jgi:hypothetical protein
MAAVAPFARRRNLCIAQDNAAQCARQQHEISMPNAALEHAGRAIAGRAACYIKPR